MKKILLVLILLVFVCLVGCGGSKVKDIEVEDITACVDNFDVTAYTFKVIYEDKEEVVNMTYDLFSDDDQLKFYEIGEHQVTLVYEGFKKTFNLTLEERKAIKMEASPSTVNSILKEFKYEMVKLNITFNDGSVETYPLSREYLSNQDIISLGKPGTYDIEITYENVSTVVHFELLPNETNVEDLKQDVIVYCITKKVEDKYVSTFYALGNKDFSGVQFKMTYASGVNVVDVQMKQENITSSKTNEYLAVMFASSKNIKGTVELFTVTFTASSQYRNFNMDYDFDVKVVCINNGEVEAMDSYLFTLTR